MKTTYDNIGTGYNLTRTADPYLVERMQHHLNLKPNCVYLDIGCGTGNYTLALQDITYNFIGVDPSHLMLDEAKSKSHEIVWQIGNSEEIPQKNDSIEAVLASLTIHHWAHLQKGFIEINRVLKSQGKCVIFTATPQQMRGYWLNHYFPEMMEDSINKMPSFEAIENCLTESGLTITETETYTIKPDLQDLFLYSGKHNPKLYLNEQVRCGISSFSALANKNEVQLGLSALEADINSDKIINIIENYENNDGDYLFIIAEKI